MQRITSTITFFSLVFLLQSCSVPSPILRLTPLGTKVEWDQGREVMHQDQEGIQMHIGFENSDKDYLIFNVKIKNTSTEIITIFPEKAFLTDTFYNYKMLAIDPESMLLDLELKNSKREAARKNGELLSIVATTTAVVTTIATSDGNFIYYNGNGGTREKEMTQQPSFWANATLRKTDLKPGFQIHGRVLFPRMDHLQRLQLHFPIGNRVFSMPFQQQVFKP